MESQEKYINFKCGKDGLTSLHYALKYGQILNFEMLVKHHGCPFIPDSANKFPLDYLETLDNR